MRVALCALVAVWLRPEDIPVVLRGGLDSPRPDVLNDQLAAAEQPVYFRLDLFRVVALLPDSGDRYLSTPLFSDD